MIRKKKNEASAQLNEKLTHVVDRNVSTLLEVRRQLRRGRSIQDRVADVITHFSGSLFFLYFHILWFYVWVVVNMGWTHWKPFDPYPFGFLTMVVSLEAIFLSTFVLISQNRISEESDLRADLDLQINLLAEYEITKLLKLVDAIADHIGLDIDKDPELEDLMVELSPDIVLKKMEKKKLKINFEDIASR